MPSRNTFVWLQMGNVAARPWSPCQMPHPSKPNTASTMSARSTATATCQAAKLPSRLIPAWPEMDGSLTTSVYTCVEGVVDR